MGTSNKFWKALLLLVTLGHFIYFLLEKREIADLTVWEKNTCYFTSRRNILDGDCRYYNVKRFIFAQPHLNYGEKLICQTAHPQAVKKFDGEVLESSCPMEDIWGYPKRLWDLGWDAYSIWYGRAVALYFQSQKSSWPGLLKAIEDKAFVQSFANIEHHHYPWLVSIIYFSLMKVMGSPNPFPLMVLQMLVWLLCAYLLFAIWPHCPLYAWVVFAFVPTSAAFMFRLYADIWVVLFGLLILFFLEAERRILAALFFFLGCFLKQEAFLQLGALAVTFHLIENPKFKDIFAKKNLMFWILTSIATSLVLWHTSRFESKDFYVSLSQRFHEKSFYLSLFPQILGYYADVFFRPAMWGLGTFWLMWVFVTSLKRVGVQIYLPLLIVLVAIPLAYARYPFGYKEVVLTGAGRALWQSLPLLWLLLKNAHEKSARA